MTEQIHEQIDFLNMPLTNEQKTLAVLERIEILLQILVDFKTPVVVSSPITVEKAPVAPKGKFGRK